MFVFDWLIDWKFYLISVARLVKYYFRWPSHSYAIYKHSYYYTYTDTYIIYRLITKIYKIVIKIESLLKDT